MLERVHEAMYHVMPDGTEKQIHPFTGTEVWAIPGRRHKPITNERPKTAKKLEVHTPEDYCNFCEANYLNTPPEKSRLVRGEGGYFTLDRIDPSQLFATTAEFRRIPNLFEIVSVDYWKKNHDYRLCDKNLAWKQCYLSSKEGLGHVLHMIDMKLSMSGCSEAQLRSMSVDEKLEHADAFFGGCHELVIYRRHYIPGAKYDSDSCSSGMLTPDEHFWYFKFTIAAMDDIYDQNRYVRYVSVYQNWLRPAGASFDHLHKQLVGLDEWGVSVERELQLAHSSPNMYNEYAANFASYQNLVVAENDFAMAFVDLGHRYPTIAIYSKSQHCKPSEHTDEELRGVSDIVHAIHAAMGNQLSCNEEWYYMPRDAIIPMPWHVLIKWRVNIPAGFEGGTKIYVNPFRLKDLRDMIVPRLFEVRDQGLIAGICIAQECEVKPNSLKYYLNGRC